jgi:hypothetical protein
MRLRSEGMPFLSPRPPLNVALEQLQLSDAVVLVMGFRAGSLGPRAVIILLTHERSSDAFGNWASRYSSNRERNSVEQGNRAGPQACLV